jgi:hypothetical protein
MSIGRFFSLNQGRVGQYLSPRVLVVLAPFQSVSRTGEPHEFCCFGFESFKQAQKFGQSLSRIGMEFQLRSSQIMPDCTYEVVLTGGAELARTLAYWNRQTSKQVQEQRQSKQYSPVQTPVQPTPAIAA